MAAAMADRHEKVPVINIAQTGLFKWATASGSAGFTEPDGVVQATRSVCVVCACCLPKDRDYIGYFA
jgi:hypothetical protein